VLNTSSTGLKNALSASVCNELIDALSHLEEEPSCAAVIFTGMGRVFCQVNVSHMKNIKVHFPTFVNISHRELIFLFWHMNHQRSSDAQQKVWPWPSTNCSLVS
jgi:hypothetical protein